MTHLAIFSSGISPAQAELASVFDGEEARLGDPVRSELLIAARGPRLVVILIAMATAFDADRWSNQ